MKTEEAANGCQLPNKTQEYTKALSLDLECIKWIDDAAFRMISEIDSFDEIYETGINPFIKFVQQKWNERP